MSRTPRSGPALAALTLALLVSGCGSGTVASTDAETADDVGSAAGTSAGSSDPGTDTPAGDTPATLDFTAETVSGKTFEGAGLAGKPTVLWFWAPWCPTCHAQIAGVGELAASYGADVNVVGVGALDEPEAIEGFAEGVSPEVTLLSDPDGAVWRHFEVTAQSTYVVLDRDGAEVASGYLDDADLVDVVDGVVG